MILLFLSIPCQVELTGLLEDTNSRHALLSFSPTVSCALFNITAYPSGLYLQAPRIHSLSLKGRTVLSLETSSNMKIPSIQVIIWVICTATMAAPIGEQSPIGDGDLTRVIEESGDPDLAEFASRVQTASGGSKLLTARPSPGSSDGATKGTGRVLGQGEGSCFCSGGSVCCRQGSGVIDCGFGLCGI